MRRNLLYEFLSKKSYVTYNAAKGYVTTETCTVVCPGYASKNIFTVVLGSC